MKGFCAWPGKVSRAETLMSEQADLSLCAEAVDSLDDMHIVTVCLLRYFLSKG